jgi:hypothetical protein
MQAECLQRLGAKLVELDDEEEAMHLIEKELQLFCLKSMCCRNTQSKTHPADISTSTQHHEGDNQSMSKEE